MQKYDASTARAKRATDEAEVRREQCSAGWKSVRAGKSDERAEQDSGKARRSSSR